MLSKEDKKIYDRVWIAKRRRAFFDGKVCLRCGSIDRLELDHINPADKIDHRIWSWSLERREVETAKCQVLCKPCHIKKSADEVRGKPGKTGKLNPEKVRIIRRLIAARLSQRKIGKLFGVNKSAIARIRDRKTWTHVD